jgi:hypothetical protein
LTLWLGLLVLLPCLGLLLPLRRLVGQVRAALVCAVAAGAGLTLGDDAPGGGQMAAAEGLRLVVTAEQLNRRTCPDTGCGRLGRISAGETVTAHEAVGPWVRITEYGPAQCENGQSALVTEGDAACTLRNGITDGRVAAWVHGDFLDIARSATSASER